MCIAWLFLSYRDVFIRMRINQNWGTFLAFVDSLSFSRELRLVVFNASAVGVLHDFRSHYFCNISVETRCWSMVQISFARISKNLWPHSILAAKWWIPTIVPWTISVSRMTSMSYVQIFYLEQRKTKISYIKMQIIQKTEIEQTLAKYHCNQPCYVYGYKEQAW